MLCTRQDVQQHRISPIRALIEVGHFANTAWAPGEIIIFCSRIFGGSRPHSLPMSLIAEHPSRSAVHDLVFRPQCGSKGEKQPNADLTVRRPCQVHIDKI